MTENDIRTMPAGPEFDAWLGINLFGYCWVYDSIYHCRHIVSPEYDNQPYQCPANGTERLSHSWHLYLPEFTVGLDECG